MWKSKPSSQPRQNSFWHRWFWTRQRTGSKKYNTWQGRSSQERSWGPQWPGQGWGISHLDHAVAVGIGDMGLQARKQRLVVMLEVKVFQSQLGVFDCDLSRDTTC